MDRVALILLCGAAFAVPLAIVGALFGGLARFFAQKRNRSPEKTPQRALVVGAVRGGIFLMMLGCLVGSAFGYFFAPGVAQILVAAVELTLVFVFIALIAVAFGMLAHVLESFYGSDNSE